MRRLHLLLIPLLACASAAHGVNKCTDAQGRTTYQQQSCNKESKAAVVDLPAPPVDAASQWRFSKERDAMTGETTCFALSPTTYTNWSRGMATHSQVYMQLAVPEGGARMILTVRTYDFDNTGMFHIKTDDQGIKVTGGKFYPLTEKSGSHALVVESASTGELLGALGAATGFTLRLRFWPYDRLHDTKAIPLGNFNNAVRQAMKCAI